MSQPYVGEIRLVGFNFQVNGWAFCNGQLMPISENEVLFQLIGTTYGGDGQSTFALPDLRGRVPVHQGTSGQGNFVIGQMAGVETVTLSTNQIAQHNHLVNVSTTAGSLSTATNSSILSSEGPSPNSANVYLPYAAANQVALANQTIGTSGGNQPHENMQPYVVMNYIISLFGVFPTQN